MSADAVDVEAGFPVAADVEPEGDVFPSSVPGGDAVQTVHIGPYETLGNTYRDMADWMERHGRRPARLSWESYLTDPADPAGPETLVVWPIAEDDRVAAGTGLQPKPGITEVAPAERSG